MYIRGKGHRTEGLCPCSDSLLSVKQDKEHIVPVGYVELGHCPFPIIDLLNMQLCSGNVMADRTLPHQLGIVVTCRFWSLGQVGGYRGRSVGVLPLIEL